jgi:hypothetical protein
MKKTNLKTTFGKWYKQNRKRFNFQPVFGKKHWNHINFTFQGLSPKLLFTLDYSGANIFVMNHKEVWDILIEFSTYPARTAWGQYYCHQCLPEYREFFPSRQSLWEKHCFELLLEWVNDDQLESKWIGLFHVKGGTWVEMKGKEEIEAMKAKEEFVEAFPIVETP